MSEDRCPDCARLRDRVRTLEQQLMALETVIGTMEPTMLKAPYFRMAVKSVPVLDTREEWQMELMLPRFGRGGMSEHQRLYFEVATVSMFGLAPPPIMAGRTFAALRFILFVLPEGV